MNRMAIGAVLLSIWTGNALAQDRIYRCGNEYINNAAQAKQRGCQVVEGGNVTIIQSSPPPAARPSRPAASSNATAPRQASSATASSSGNQVPSTTQAARDGDARLILETELQRNHELLAKLEDEYNAGNPVRTALELRNPQGYLERTANLKAEIERTKADIDGIQRELSRLR